MVYKLRQAFRNNLLTKTKPPEAHQRFAFRMTLDGKLMQLQCIWQQKSAFMTNCDFDEAKSPKCSKEMALGEIFVWINANKGSH